VSNDQYQVLLGYYVVIFDPDFYKGAEFFTGQYVNLGDPSDNFNSNPPELQNYIDPDTLDPDTWDCVASGGTAIVTSI
jgi:hypothetical protein